MNEKDNLINNWEREFQTTLKCLKNFPSERQNYKPHEISKSAKELAWLFVSEEQTFVNGIIAGKIDFSNMAKSPDTINEVIHDFEKAHKETITKLKELKDEEFNAMMEFPVAPKKMMDFRKIDLMWMFLMDSIHHRGQFTVYLRLVGAKVPSIYGPSADELW